MDIRFLDIAQRELDEAVESYNAESPGLGEQFLLEVLRTLERIKQYPEAWHPFTQNTRRCQTRRFPYGVVYQILESELLIVAIAHYIRSQGIGKTEFSSQAEHRAAPDCLQRALLRRSRFRQQVSPGVAMICIAIDCVKSTYQTTFRQLLAQSLSKSSDFLICTARKS